ncbi:MAG TPA: methyltransferase [Blastocatellia bacterium]|jgi:ubiquinone/menaquinone biosynthesis C-methylase UbiE|nr:methyltransferase [Blastocatellia bacterium]
MESNVTPQQIINDLWAARAAQALVAGVELDLFTHIDSGLRTAKEIARAAKSNARATERLLDALTGLGYLNKKNGNYGLEPVAEQFLVKGKPAYMGAFAYETRLTWNGWAQLTEVIKTGRPIEAVDTDEGGREFFPKLVEAIFPMSYNGARAAVAAMPEKGRKRIKNILDVAAGSAAWSLPFAEAIPDARVTVVDYPEVTSVARRFVERFGVADRYDYVEGNLREIDFGREKYDLVILGHIIHSEGEKWGKKLIKKSYRALADNGMLLIAEMVPNDTRSGPPMPLLFGLNMIVHTENGDVFTMREYREWLKEAGFRRVTTIDAPGPSPLILATK